MDDREQLIIALTHTPNRLAKRITPQRDMTKLNRAPGRGELSAREIVAQLRDTEARYFPKLHLIGVGEHPDLRRVRDVGASELDPDDSAFTVMAQFRRLRQSTLSLLRELPRDAWRRTGVDVDNAVVSIHDLAHELVEHDREALARLDAILDARGALPKAVRPLVTA